MRSDKLKGKKKRVIERDGLKCKLCGTDLTVEQVTLDHIVPKSRGGCSNIENLQVACEPCNIAKADKDTVNETLRRLIKHKLSKPLVERLAIKAERRDRDRLKKGWRKQIKEAEKRNAARLLTRPLCLGFEERLSLQKQDEERLVSKLPPDSTFNSAQDK